STGRNELIWNGAVDLNAVNPVDLAYGVQLYDLAFLQSLRPFPQFTGLNVDGLYPGGRYQRDSGYVQLEKRASNGLEMTARYQFSKQFDDYSGPYGIQDFFNRQNDWALSAYNAP